jgi:uncharacterized protein YjbJ (UPF0337 family)
MQKEDVERQVKGTAQTFMGRIKEGFNRLFGSRRGQIEGKVEELRGRSNVEGGSIKEKVESKLQDAKEKVQGRAEELKQKAQEQQQQLHH